MYTIFLLISTCSILLRSWYPLSIAFFCGVFFIKNCYAVVKICRYYKRGARFSGQAFPLELVKFFRVFFCFLQVPYVGLNFAVYESLKDWLIKSNALGLNEGSDLGVTTRLACGAAAGTVGQTVAYPLDVVRRRMQMVGWKDASSIITGDRGSRAPLEYTGMIDAFRKTVKYEGFGALYKGLVPNSVKVGQNV